MNAAVALGLAHNLHALSWEKSGIELLEAQADLLRDRLSDLEKQIERLRPVDKPFFQADDDDYQPTGRHRSEHRMTPEDFFGTEA